MQDGHNHPAPRYACRLEWLNLTTSLKPRLTVRRIKLNYITAVPKMQFYLPFLLPSVGSCYSFIIVVVGFEKVYGQYAAS